jgi:hypothetical protein
MCGNAPGMSNLICGISFHAKHVSGLDRHNFGLTTRHCVRVAMASGIIVGTGIIF